MIQKSELALRLKALRNEKGVTAQEVADAIGIKSSRYRRYELDTKPKDEIYSKLAEYFGVTIDFLMRGSSGLKADMEYDVPDTDSGMSEKQLEILREAKLMSDEQLQEVIEFMKWKNNRA